MSADDRRLVIVGASLAGLRAAQVLRQEGFTGSLTLIGDEPHAPYDRPPLSKDFLTSEDPPPDTGLPVPVGLGARLLLGSPATALSPDERVVTLADGTRVPYDGLLIATGAKARRWPGAPPPSGVLTLRGRDDATALRRRLGSGHRLVVVGAGFLGGEIAAAAHRRGARVALIEASPQPLASAVGPTAGAYVAALHREAGIDLRTSTTVTAFESRHGRLAGVRLSDGTRCEADTVVLALGAVPATGWLATSGLDTGLGVRCDARLRALRPDGTVVPGVVAAGDVASVPNALADGRPVVLGHWTNAVEQAQAAARTLLAPHGPDVFRGVPSFWSDLHGARFRSVGLPALADTEEVRENDLAGRRLEIAYHRNGALVGALTAGRTGRLARYREALHRTVSGQRPGVGVMG
ncbi:NAD(P)/FAD-dependent oxidoreductase [Streptomyces sp. NPDC058442]|uniref:NAD(P)/FAD-dependent oxidoreductase n=1 Tax=Streptomyces sp. NPDC058442 TaxID=3346503 RepID=UPI00364A7A2B